jgi:glycosyltransferase involved in cell wall biosynthesis
MKFIFYSPAVGAPWDYTSLESGVGGSETFHIEMATRLARRGHEVISYNDKPDRDVFDVSRGVCWRQISELDMNFDRVNGPAIWVVQRNPLFIDRPSPSGPNPQKWWHVYHDVQYAPHDTPARMARYDRVIALSEFHAEFLRNMGHENVTASRGGIAVDRMHELVARIMECAPMVCRSIPEGNACRPRSAEEKADYLTRGRNLARLIYASAPERGLLPLLRMFARAKEHVAALELHVYYGWEGYDRQLAQDFTGRWAREKAEMVRLLAQPGVTWHGRVTQTELWTAHLQSGIWVYPTEYPEVCCVTAMEAQALGAIPIYTPTWALQDHVFSGICLEGACSEDRLAHARFAMEIVRLASSPAVQEAKRPGMMAEASARFDWEGVCDQFEEMAVVDLGCGTAIKACDPGTVQASHDGPYDFMVYGCPGDLKPEQIEMQARKFSELTQRVEADFLTFPNHHAFGDELCKDVFPRRANGDVFGGWFGDENKRNLERLIAKYNVKTVCEIGCFLGYSTAWFARRVEKVYCVDKWIAYAEDPGDAELLRIVERLGIPHDFYDVWRRNMEAEGLFYKVIPVRGFSVASAHLVPSVDLVYIDGDHTYAGCLADIGAYGPKAKMVVCGDDFGSQHPGVHAALECLPYQHEGPFWWIEPPIENQPQPVYGKSRIEFVWDTLQEPGN